MILRCITNAILCAAFSACDRQYQLQNSDIGPGNQIAAQPPIAALEAGNPGGVGTLKRGPTKQDKREIESARQQAMALLLAKNKDGRLDADALSQLTILLPWLKDSEEFWDIIGLVPSEQLSNFRDLVYEALRKLAPAAGKPIDPHYKNAFSTVEFMKDPEVAKIAFAQLPLVPPYQYPDKPPPDGWPIATPETVELITRGYSGLLAQTVVLSGDQGTMKKYRQELLSSPTELKRVMVWALGRSPDQEDFDLLMTLREQANDPGMQDTVTRALNRILVSMRSVAEYPEIVSQVRRPKDPKALLEAAAKNEARLKDLGLIVHLTFYD